MIEVKTKSMKKEDVIWRRICIRCWLGDDAEVIVRDLEKEYERLLPQELRRLIADMCDEER